ncbi:MAG: ImmA/IrrE family metallo-endopeptidase [Myxococcales bacterium]|nr:ImmA/IrrE family metallo-endopeptidase [Myxococcales bacterium]
MTTTIQDVPYLDKKRIEFNAQVLLDEFQQRHRVLDGPPVPVETVLELHLGLHLAITDLRAEFGSDDVIGAINVNTKEVFVDEHLDPTTHGDLEGRYHFTLAHEIGHWQLHRRYVGHLADAAARGKRRRPKAAYLCRSGDAKLRIEWQADYFAACLLMPRPLVYRAWKRKFGANPLTEWHLAEKREELLQSEIARRAMTPTDAAEEAILVWEGAILPLAEQFRVSPIAMRIRLEELKLLVR